MPYNSSIVNEAVNINPKQGYTMLVNVKVRSGNYGGKQVINEVFPLVKEFNVGKNGGFVTVDGTRVMGYPDRVIRIKLVSKNDYEVVNSNIKEVTTPEVVKTEQSDEERLGEIPLNLTEVTPTRPLCLKTSSLQLLYCSASI